MSHLRFGLSVIALLAGAGLAFAQPAQPCFAYLLKADVVAVCQGKTVQVTHRGDVDSFAISEERSSLAYVTSRTMKRGETSNEIAYTISVVNLQTGDTKSVQDARTTGVVSTCGGILGIEIGSGGPVSIDFLTGTTLRYPPYIFFRCSADRKVVAGVAPGKTGRYDALYAGSSPTRRITSGDELRPHFFNVSPDGSKIAWFNDVRPLCVYAGSEPAQCVEHSTMSDAVSVNNAGEVLAAAGTGKGCYYKTSFNFAPPQKGESDNDECLGVGFWKPGLKAIRFLEPIGRNPQWINPSTAEMLVGWSAKAH